MLKKKLRTVKGNTEQNTAGSVEEKSRPQEVNETTFQSALFYHSNLPQAVVDADTYTVQQANEIFAEVFSFQVNEVLGKTLQAMINQEDPTIKFVPGFHDTSGEVIVPLKERDGRITHYRIIYTAVLLNDRKFYHLIFLTYYTDGLSPFNDEIYKTYLERSSEAIWCYSSGLPLETNKPVEEQIDIMMEEGVLVECNDTLARMYGFEKREEIIGTPLKTFLILEEEKNRLHLREFIENGYRIENSESYERDNQGNAKVILNNMFGVFENNHLVRVWGTQRDITSKKRAEKVQEFILHIAQATSTSSQLSELIRIIHTNLEELIPAPNFYVALYNPKNDHYTFPFDIDSYDKVESNRPYNLKNTLTDWVRKNEESILVIRERDKEKLEKMGINPYGKPATSWMGVPLRTHEGTIGVVTVQSYDEKEVFTKNDLDILEYISGQIAISIEKKNAELALRQSEERYRNLFFQSPVGVFLYDMDLKVIHMNDKFAQILKSSYEEIIGLDLNTVTEETVITALRSPLEGKVSHYEGQIGISYLDADIYLSAELSPLIDDENNVFGAIGVVIDISMLKFTEQQLRVQNAHLEELFERTPEPTVLLDIDCHITRINRAFAELFGFSHNEAVGKHISDLIVSDAYKEKTESWTKSVIAGKTTFLESVCHNIQGKQIDVSIVGAPIWVGDDLVSIYGIFRDITETKRSEKLQSVLFNISDATSSTGDLDGLLKIIHHELSSLIRLSNFAVVLYDRERDLYQTKFSVDQKGDFVAGAMQSLRGGMTDKVRVTGATQCVDKETLKKMYSSGEIVPIGSMATLWIGVPLKTDQEVLGVIIVQSYEENPEISEKDIEILEFVSDHIAVAIERKTAYEAFANEKERLAVTLRSIGEGVITTDIDGKIVLMNKVAENLTGWREKDAIGTHISNIYTIVSQASGKQAECPVDVILRTHDTFSWTRNRKLIDKHGNDRNIADCASAIRDPDSQIVGVVIVFRDITNQQKLEEELLQARKLDSLGLLAGGIAHDFNNILSGILGNISLAKMYSSADKTELNQRLIQAEKASVRARDLTQQLLTFSKGGAPIRKSASIVELVEDSTSFALRGSNVKKEVYYSEDIWSAIIDEGQISQVIQNLVINADQAMPEGGRLRIACENTVIQEDDKLPVRPGNYVKLVISDNGKGIAPEHLDKVFDPYFTTKQMGTGLGLATSFSIISKHDGHITVDSTIGAGTTFTIYLPASDEEIEQVGSKNLKDNGIQVTGKILIMDDEELVLNVLSKMLSVLKFVVDVSTNGEEAVAKYKKALTTNAPYDLVILDLTIPGGMGGQETLKNLAKIHPGVKAIATSGYSNDPIMAEYGRFGFSGIVTKPYTVGDLKRVVYEVLGV